MGIYVNPGNSNFRQALNSPIYIDKSMLVAEIIRLINTEGKYVCVSRARRFGKSMAGNMLAAYFSRGCDSRDLFQGLKLSCDPNFEKYLNKLNVLHFDVNGFYSNYGPGVDIVEKFTSKINRELQVAFPDAGIADDDTIADCLAAIYATTGEQFVIIMDEYDVLVRERVPRPIFDSYLRFLNAMFKNINVAPAIALAYLTGILPIVRDKIQSKLNLFQEYTMLNSLQLAEFTGFTAGEVEALCAEYGMDYEECRRWYDGYRINGLELYSPKSVVSAMTARKFGSYWSKTGSFGSLKDFIQMDFMGLRADIKTMLGGGSVEVDTGDYLNTMTDFNSKDDAFTYLIHIGYLAYDEETGSCSIPNHEIAGEWVRAIKGNDNYRAAFDLLTASKQLVDSTIAGDAGAVADALNRSHEEICNNLNYNNEGTFQAVICLAYFYAKARYTVIKEMPTGKGYADIVLVPYVPGIPAIIIELKRNGSTGGALPQIEAKRYFASLEKYRGDLMFVGVNYDEKIKEHSCEIRRFAI